MGESIPLVDDEGNQSKLSHYMTPNDRVVLDIIE